MTVAAGCLGNRHSWRNFIRVVFKVMECSKHIVRKSVVHLIDKLTIGGIDRVIANFIIGTQDQPITNIIISLKAVDSRNLMPSHVDVISLDKQEGHDIPSHYRLWKILREIKPDIIHTYNLSCIEFHPVAWIAGVRWHIHAEHGRLADDPEGLNKKHNQLRRAMAVFVHSYVSVSADLHAWLVDHVGIPENKAVLIQNGINTEQFNLDKTLSKKLRFAIIARVSLVKDHMNLLNAFLVLKEELGLDALPQLTIVGDGDQKDILQEFCRENGLDNVEFLGARDDIRTILASTDVFVLSSIAEGIPMTILEAMSAKTPVVSTNVGGISEVVADGVEGYLVEKSNPVALAKALKNYICQPELIIEHGENARLKVLSKFNEKNMIDAYLYQYRMYA